MAEKIVSIGSMLDKWVFDDDDGSIAVQTDAPIRTTSAPAVNSDVLRLEDTSAGSITEYVLGIGGTPYWRIRVDLVTFDFVREKYVGGSWIEVQRTTYL